MSLSSKTMLYGVAVLAERGISFFLLPVLAKTISPVEYAIWAQSIVVAGVLNPLLLLGFQTALVKFFPLWESSPAERDSVLVAMLATIFVLLAIASGLVLSLADSVAGFVYGRTVYKTYVPLLVVFLASEALYQFLISFLRATHHFRMISLYTVLKSMWRLGIFLVVLHCTNWGFYRAFIAFVFIQGLFVVLMYAKDVPYARLFRTSLSAGRKHWAEVLSFSLPLVALWIMTGLNNFTDRFFLTHLRGLEEVAAYSAAYSLAAVSAIFYSVLGLTLFPALTRLWALERTEEAAALVARAIRVYLVFVLPFIAGATVAGQDVLAILTTDDYVVPRIVFMLLACNVGLFGLYSISLYVLMLERSTGHLAALMGLAAGVNALLNASLVPYLGATGSAIAGIVSNSLLAGATLYWSRRALNWHFPLGVVIRIGLRAGIMVAFIWLAQSWLTSKNALVELAVLFIAGLLYMGLDSLEKKGSLLTLIGQS